MKVIEQKIRSLYHSTVYLWLVSVFCHIFSFFWVLPLPPFCLFFTILKTSYPDPLTLYFGRHFELISTLRGQISHVISAVCQGLLSCHRHIGKREDSGDEVATTVTM